MTPDGPTLYQAAQSLNSSVANQSGGPWTLFSLWGVASTVPFAPSSLAWSNYNETVNSCQAQFNGVTLWNGSIPLFNGTYNSGTAPFWQFAYFSNNSHAILIATDVEQKTHVFPMMLMSSACASSSGLGVTPWTSATTYFSTFPPNSPTMAASAWSAVGALEISSKHPLYQAYVLGLNNWGSGPIGLTMRFGRCGALGAAGLQPATWIVFNQNGSWNNFLNGSQGCGNLMSLGPPPTVFPYLVILSNETQVSYSGMVTYTQSFQVEAGMGTGNYNQNGLVTWMMTLELKSPANKTLPRSSTSCSNWVASISDCPVPIAGWYAVLMSPDQQWIDGGYEPANGLGWSVPNVAIVSHQFLTIIAPSGWNLSGDSLSILPTSSEAPVVGTSTL